eukprot:TRINITY_DN533_c0_g1_i1.p1 TRINITY_DN533_c0_g1~~TRINITY_DN533_c0_g1_i1.p1  ORF type:complete len:341 (-),score=25.41 TRINITY_DN533_c0_g1_i1:37-1026(-)
MEKKKNFIICKMADTVQTLTLILTTIPPICLIILTQYHQRWFKNKFVLHRVGGLVYLIAYVVSWYLYLMDYDSFKESVFSAMPAMLGVVQAFTAVTTFTFLPKSKDDSGYFSDNATINYKFIKENLFYQLMTLFGTIYYSQRGYKFLSTNPLGLIFESVWVFLPYVLIRPFFPTTHFRDALKNDEGKSKEYITFYYYGVYIIKFFYIAAKHYMGFFINYLHFVGGFSETEMMYLQGMVLANAGTVSISVFLHTLRFKKVLHPKVSYIFYMLLAYAPFIGFVHLLHVFPEHLYIFLLSTIGMVLNVANRPLSYWYQGVLFLGFNYYRYFA